MEMERAVVEGLLQGEQKRKGSFPKSERKDSSASLNASDRTQSVKKIDANSSLAQNPALSKKLERAYHFFINALALNEITENKLKDKTFSKNLSGLLEGAKSGKSISLEFLAYVLAQEIQSIEDASKPIVKVLKENANEQLIFDLGATLRNIITSEKDNSAALEKKNAQIVKTENQSKKEANEIAESQNIANDGKKEEDEVSEAENIEKDGKTEEGEDSKTLNIGTKDKNNANKSKLQLGAEQSAELLHKIHWELDPFGTPLVIKHIKDPLMLILDIVTQFSLIIKFIKPIIKDGKLEESAETDGIIEAYISALVAVAIKYIKGAAEESHPANMRSIPEGVASTIVAIVMSAILEYYSKPHEKDRVIHHKLVAKNGDEYELEIPIEIIQKVFKAMTALQLDHGITEDAENFGEDANPKKKIKKLFSDSEKKITNRLFSNEKLIQDLSNLVFSLKFLSYFKSSLTKEDSAIIDKHLPEIVDKSIEKIKNDFTVLLKNTRQQQKDFSQYFLTIEFFIKKLKTKNPITDGDLKTLQEAVRSLPQDNSKKKEIEFINELMKFKNAKAFLDNQKKLTPKLKKLLNAKKLSTNENDLFDNIEKLLKSTESKEFKDNIQKNPEITLEEFIKTFFTFIIEYKIEKLAPKYKKQIDNEAFKKLFNAIAVIALKKDLSPSDIDIIIKTLSIKLENIKNFSNSAIGTALYHAFVEAIPLTDDEIDGIESCLTNRNYQALINKITYKPLAHKLAAIFSDAPPSENDSKKIIKCLRKDKLKQTKILSQLTKLKNKSLGKRLNEKLLAILVTGDNSVKESDVNLIIESLEPKNYDALLTHLSSRPLGNAFYTLFSKNLLSENDANKIVACLKTENLSKLTSLDDKNLNGTLQSFFSILFKKKAAALAADDVDLIVKSLEPKNYDFLLELSNKELGYKLQEIISRHSPNHKEAKSIAHWLKKQTFDKLPEFKNKNLGEQLYNLLKSKKEPFTVDDIKIITKISEPINYDSLLTLPNQKVRKQFHSIIQNAQPGEADARKIIKALQNNELNGLDQLEDQALNRDLCALFFILSSSDKNKIIEGLKESLKSGNYNSLQNLFNKEIGNALHTIISAAAPSKSDVKAIATCLQKNEINKLANLKNKTLGSALRAFFTLVSAKEYITLTEDDITVFAESLEPKNYKLLHQLPNKQLGNDLFTLFSENPPSEDDSKKIVKCLKDNELWQKKELSELLELKDKAMGAKVYHALFAAIDFKKEDAKKFSKCLLDNQIENLSGISNQKLGNDLRQAFINNFLPPEKVILSICESLKTRNLENLKNCGYPELGERLYYTLFQTVAPNDSDKEILTWIIGRLDTPSQENVSSEEKKQLFKALKKYSKTNFVEHLEKALSKMQFSRSSLKEALASLLKYNKLEDLTGKGSPGNEIYHALIQSIPLSPEDIKTINRSLKTKNLEEIRNIDNADLGGALFDVFKNSITYSQQDIELFEQIFLDKYLKLKTISFSELGEVLYTFFSKAETGELPPILTDNDIKKIIDGLIEDPKKIQEISDPIGTKLCETIQETLLTPQDKYDIIKAILNNEPEKLLNISNKKFGKALYDALKDLQLKNSFEFTPLQKFLIGAVVATPNKLLGLLERLSKKKKEQKDLVRVEQLPEMLFNGIVKQPNKNFLDTIGQLAELDVPPILKSIFTQLKHYFTDTDNEFCHEVEKLLHSSSFLPIPFEILLKLYDKTLFEERIIKLKKDITTYNNNSKKPSEELKALVESSDFLTDYDKLPQKKKKELTTQFPELDALLKDPAIKFRENLADHIKDIKTFSKELDTLFGSSDFLQAYDKLSDNTKKELKKRCETNTFYNNYSSFILLILFMSHPLKSDDFEQLKKMYAETGQITLEAFTYQALKYLNMSEKEWPDFMKNEIDPNEKDPFKQMQYLIKQQLLPSIAKLGLSEVIGYKDNQECSEEKTTYPETLIKICMRMIGLYGNETEFSPESSLHKLLIQNCCVRSKTATKEKSQSEESFEQFKSESNAAATPSSGALAARIQNIAISTIPNLIESDPELLTSILELAIRTAYQHNIDTSQLFLYCIGNSELTSAIDAVFRNQNISGDLMNRLKPAILGRDAEAVKTILKKASKFDLTIFTSQSEKENILQLAYEAEKDSSKKKETLQDFPTFKAIVDHLIKTKQPYPLALYTTCPNEDLRRYLNRALTEIGFTSAHCVKKKLFPSPKTTTSSHSGDSSSEDPESHSSAERNADKNFSSSTDSASENPESRPSTEKNIDKDKAEAFDPETFAFENAFTKTFADYISKNKANQENLKELLGEKQDPTANFLTDYLNVLIKFHSKESPIKEEILQNFVEAAKTICELTSFKQSIITALLNSLSEKQNPFKDNLTMQNFNSWLKIFENVFTGMFADYINKNKANQENLKELLGEKQDPTASFLTDYFNMLIKFYNKESPVKEEILQNFIEAAKTTCELTSFKKSIVGTLFNSLSAKQNPFKDNPIMETFKSWLKHELDYETFALHIGNDTANQENLEKLFNDDPTASYLTRFINELTNSYNRKKSENVERIVKKLSDAVKTTVKLLPPNYSTTIIEILLLALTKFQSVFYDATIESLILSLNKTAVSVLKLMLNKQIEVASEKLQQLFEISSSEATEFLIEHIHSLNKEDVQLIQVLEIILQKEFVYFDKDPSKTDFVINKLRIALTENKAIAKKKSTVQLLKKCESRATLTPENLATKYAEKIKQLLKINCEDTTNFLIRHIEKLSKDDLKITEVVKMLIENELVYRDKDPNHTDYVINKLLPALKANKVLSNEKSSLTTLFKLKVPLEKQTYEQKLTKTLASTGFSPKFAEKEVCELTELPSESAEEKENPKLAQKPISGSKVDEEQLNPTQSKVAFKFTGQYSPSYSVHESKVDIEKEIKRMIVSGDLKITHNIVSGLFTKDFNKAVEIIQKYTQHFFDESVVYGHNFGLLVDLLEVIYKNKISNDKGFAIEYFIKDIDKVCKQIHAPGSGKTELCDKMKLNILIPYNRSAKNEETVTTKISTKSLN